MEHKRCSPHRWCRGRGRGLARMLPSSGAARGGLGAGGAVRDAQLERGRRARCLRNGQTAVATSLSGSDADTHRPPDTMGAHHHHHSTLQAACNLAHFPHERTYIRSPPRKPEPRERGATAVVHTGGQTTGQQQSTNATRLSRAGREDFGRVVTSPATKETCHSISKPSTSGRAARIARAALSAASNDCSYVPYVCIQVKRV